MRVHGTGSRTGSLAGTEVEGTTSGQGEGGERRSSLCPGTRCELRTGLPVRTQELEAKHKDPVGTLVRKRGYTQRIFEATKTKALTATSGLSSVGSITRDTEEGTSAQRVPLEVGIIGIVPSNGVKDSHSEFRYRHSARSLQGHRGFDSSSCMTSRANSRLPGNEYRDL